MSQNRYLFAMTDDRSGNKRRSTRLFFRACSIALVMLLGSVFLPAQASPAAGFVAFEGTLTLSSPLASEPPTGPSPTVPPVGSGEDFPVSGGNETCGKNNGDGGVWSTHVPDPLVDEIGICEGATSTGLSLPNTFAQWSLDIESEPPDVCRGGMAHDDAAGHVCTLSGNGTMYGARCEIPNRGNGSIYVSFEGPAGGFADVVLDIEWMAAIGGVPITGTVQDIDGTPHAGNVAGFIEIVPKTECLSNGAMEFSVIGELSFQGA